MRRVHKGWVNWKTWLVNPQFALWGEGVVEGLVFSLIAWEMWRMTWD